MTATLDLDLLDEWELATGCCECDAVDHHPNQAPCGEPPRYLVRLVHHHECDQKPVLKLCQTCLDEMNSRAADLIGFRCRSCKMLVRTPSDLVGPVVSL